VLQYSKYLIEDFGLKWYLEPIYAIHGCLGLFLVIAITTGRACGIEIYVPDHFATIQGAINAASTGDTIIVRPGTYMENISFGGKAITLKSELGPDVTVIDGGQKETVVLFNNHETRQSILEGFTITNGCGSYRASSNWYYGGGVRCHYSSPTIRYNIIKNNSVRGAFLGMGGGIYIYDSSPLVLRNSILHNAAWNGGGICLEKGAPVIKNNIITDNHAWNGGGLNMAADFSIIEENVICSNKSNYGGGGIMCYDHTCALISGNIVINNGGVDAGGGISVVIFGTPLLSNNIIVDNYLSASGIANGGGVFIGSNADVAIINNTIVENKAIVGGGLFCAQDSKTLVLNTILWNNSAGIGQEISVRECGWPPATLNIGHSDVKGGQASVYVDPSCTLNWGPGMIDADPLFCDESNRDFHIRFDSPCRDTGICHASLPSTDFEDDPRRVFGGVDMGADEFHYHLYSTGNLFPGGEVDIKVVGVPGQAATLALGTNLHTPPLATQYGDLHLVLPPSGLWNLGIVSQTGILSRKAVVPLPWGIGSRHPCQALIGSIGGPRAKLSNLMVLEIVEEEPPVTEYKYDDGSSENLYGLTNGGDLCWLQKYDTIPGHETIVSVNQIYGSYVYPGSSPGNGSPCEVFVWNDPTNDGDPSDCLLLAREKTTVQNVDTNTVTVVPLTAPVTVDGEFYVGCVMTLSAGVYGAPADETTVYVSGRTFFCSAAIPGSFDPHSLTANTQPPFEAGVYICIRAGW